jgi:hypothetical protein
MTPEQYERLPDAFQRIIRIDRYVRAHQVVPIDLARERREQRRLCEIIVRPGSGRGRSAAL